MDARFISRDESARWRARQYCVRGHEQNDDHRPTTFWADPQRRDTVGVGSICSSGGLRSRSEGLEAKRQENGAPAIGKEAEVPYTNEAARKQVEEKTAQELICRERHRPLSVAVRAVSPAECDVPIRKGNQAMVRNGHSMGIAAEIAENMFRAAEGPFAVDDPLMAEHLTDKGVERLRVRKMLKPAVEAELAFFESVLQSCPEFASKDEPEHFLGKKVAMARMDPALVIER